MSANLPLISLLVTEPIYDGTQDVITEIPLDARVSGSYRFQSEITQYPVESGAMISDHVRILPDEITLEGMVTDTPVTSIPTVLDLRGDNEDGNTYTRSQTAYETLLQVWRDKMLLTVVTERQVFEDMIIESLDIPQSVDRGHALWFTASMKSIITVESLIAQLPPDVVARLKRRRRKTRNKELEKHGSQNAAQIPTGKTTPAAPDTKTQGSANTAVANYKG